jgi:hypothetical protein
VSGEEAGPPQAASRSSWRRELGQWLGNPLLVTVVAALLGSWLIPQLTRKWQDHQKALEIQTGLVSQMSESVSDAAATGRFVAAHLVQRASTHPRLSEQQAWNDGYRDWTTSSASIGAKLRAYFGADIGDEWRGLADDVTNFFLLSAGNDQASRNEQVGAISSDRCLRMTPYGKKVLATGKPAGGFQDAYGQLAQRIVQCSDKVVQDVLDAHVSGF